MSQVLLAFNYSTMAIRPHFAYSLLKMFFQLEQTIKENSHIKCIYLVRLLQYLLVNVLAQDVRTEGNAFHGPCLAPLVVTRACLSQVWYSHCSLKTCLITGLLCSS